MSTSMAVRARRSLVTFAVSLLLPGFVSAQSLDCSSLSFSDTPLSAAEVPVGESVVRVCYPQLSAQGRPVFGHAREWGDDTWMVQLDTLWHMGVVLETPEPIEVGGIPLGQGRYALYAIPSDFEWTVIVSRDVDRALDGGPYHEVASTAEVGRTLARNAGSPEAQEVFSVSGAASGPASGDLVIAWEHGLVRVPIRSAAAMTNTECAFRGGMEAAAERTSPGAVLDVPVGRRMARLCYGRPSARDRVVFGGLVPWDDMWRTGANEPTTLHIPFPAEIAGIPVPAGSYAIYTIPSPGEWVVIVNAQTAQWGRVTPTERGGRSQYAPEVRAGEMGRALVPSERTESHVETFEIRAVPGAGPDSADLVLEWERARVLIPIRAR